MAREPALNEEALVKLGSEKLARLVIGEAKRNAAFRKLVEAARNLRRKRQPLGKRGSGQGLLEQDVEEAQPHGGKKDL